MRTIRNELKMSIRHLIKAIYLCCIAMIHIFGNIVSLLTEFVCRKPKTFIMLFILSIFIVCMYQQGRVVIAEQGDMKLMKLKDDTINRLQSDVNFYKSMSNHPREVHDTIRIVKYKPIIKRDSI